MEKLKKCPFCGGEATIKNNSTFKMDYDDYKVSCTKCGATIEPNLLTREEAINAWNGRINNKETVKEIIDFLVKWYGVDGVKIC